MIEIPVELGARRYAVYLGHGTLRLMPEILGKQYARTVVVSNRRIWDLHGKRLEKALKPLSPTPILVPDGETRKSLATWSRVHDAFLDARLGRDGLVIAVGGGVVGDLTGFAAATYMRGVDWAIVPTSLIAMVDSSVGGKVGVNHPRVKNLIGAFHQPRAVVVDPSFLETLPRRQIQSGVYEILKSGVIADRALFRSIHDRPEPFGRWERVDVENAIASALRIKVDVVEKDEHEHGLRRVLNLGHTLGHALEAVTRYRRFSHGEAVGWGLIGAAWIACRRGLLKTEMFDSIAAAVDGIGARPRLSDLSTAALLAAVAGDKKARAGRATFVLPTGIGRVAVRSDVTPQEIRRALRVMASREARLD